MLSSPRARFAYALIMLPAFAVVLGLAVIVQKQAVSAGAAEAWMMAGVLSVVVALPLALFMLPIAGWLRRRVAARAIVPNMGENVPRAGQ